MAKRGNVGDSGEVPSEKNSTKSSRSDARDAGLSSQSRDRTKTKSDLLSDLDAPQVTSPKKSKTATESRAAGEAQKGSREAVDSVARVSQKSRDNSKRYRDTATEVHPAGSYCSATRHEAGPSKCLPVEQLKALMAQAQARANEGASKVELNKQDIPLPTAKSIHIAHNLDLKNLEKGQDTGIKYQASNFESFTPQAKHSEHPVKEVAKSAPSQTPQQAPESPRESSSVTKTSSSESPSREPRTGRSFSAPEYQIHQESLDFYQAHKKAFQTADERFQKMPAKIPVAKEHSEHIVNQTSPTQKQKIERIDPYYALNYQLAKDNSLFNPPQGEYRVKSIEKADPVKHPDALALDIPESRLLNNVPTAGIDKIIQNAEEQASGKAVRASEILDSVEAMMDDEPNRTAEKDQHVSNESERRFVMLLDGKHNGFLFPAKRTGEAHKNDATIPSITKIFLPDGNFKFVRGEESAGKVQFPNIKEFIGKIKSKLSEKTQHSADQAREQEKTVRSVNAVFPQTIVGPAHTGTIVIKDLKPGTPEPEPLASQLTKAQKTKQQEDAKKQESKDTRPESKTGNKDAYQGRLPEIKMSYSKSQPSTKDFTKLKPTEKHPVKETGEVRSINESENVTRIRDIYAKFDIQLPRKKLRPEITESGTYKIISNQTSQKLPAVSDNKIEAPYEVASFFKEEDKFPGGDPQNPENKPFPKIAASMAEEPRRSYVVKQGETIEYIAVAELHEAALAPLIREINEILLEQFFDHEKQEPASSIPAGVMLLLPNKKDIIAYRLKVARNRQ